jgi:hypothetical protein
MLKNFHPHAVRAPPAHGNALLAAGLGWRGGPVPASTYDAPTPFLTSTFGFSLVAIGFALLTCAALSPASLLNRMRIPARRSLALWSYAVYLVHKPVFMALRPSWNGCTSIRRAADHRGGDGGRHRGGWVLYRWWRRRSCGCGRAGAVRTAPLIPSKTHSIARPARSSPGGSTVTSSPP